MHRLNGHNHRGTKSHNRQAILQLLLHRPLSRIELAQQLSLSTTTLTNLINELSMEGWVGPKVVEREPAGSPTSAATRGRPRTLLTIIPDAAYVIGVHIGIGTFHVGQVDLCGNLHAVDEGQFPVDMPPSAVVSLIAAAVAQLIQVAEIESNQILGIGFGASGLVDTQRGVNLIAPSLGWRHVPIADLLSEATSLPVVVDNNVRGMALAESLLGSGQDAASMAFVFGRIGIGAGFVVGGHVVRGQAGGAGEIGHTLIMPKEGKRCRCGQFGCLETVVTQPAIIEKLSQHSQFAAWMEPSLTRSDREQFERLLLLVDRGEAAVIAAFEEAAFYLGVALRNIVNTLNPERIVLGGMYAQGSALFLPMLREHVARTAFGTLGEQVKIEASAFGLNAGIIGAASVGLKHYFYEAAVVRPMALAATG